MLRTEFLCCILVENRRESGIFNHPSDYSAIVKMLDDVLNIGREAVDVVAKILLYKSWIFFGDTMQCPFGFVREGYLFRVKLKFLNQLLKLFILYVGSFLAYFICLLFPPVNQNTLKTPDNYNRQDYTLIFICLKLTAQPFGRLPDFICKIVKLGFIYRGSHY